MSCPVLDKLVEEGDALGEPTCSFTCLVTSLFDEVTPAIFGSFASYEIFGTEATSWDRTENSEIFLQDNRNGFLSLQIVHVWAESLTHIEKSVTISGAAAHTPYVCIHCMKKRLLEQFGGAEVLYPNEPPPWYSKS